MLPALHDSERLLCRRICLMLCCGALFVTPFVSERSFSASAQPGVPHATALAPRLPKRLSGPPLALARDPFLPDSWANEIQASRATGASPLDIVLPPNTGARVESASSAAESATLVLRAVVLGPASRALVESDGSVRVVAIGDALGGSTVSAITARGIVLASGAIIDLAKSSR